MDYPAEILEDDVISGTNIRLLDHCVFVAIKNGEHMSKGYAFFDDRVKDVDPPDDKAHVGAIYDYIASLFSH